jgi:heat shock protein HtpX
MLRDFKVWLFLIALSLLILLLGHLTLGRPGLLFAFVLALTLNYFTLLHQHRGPIEFLHAEPLKGRDAWGLIETLNHLLSKAKMPEPDLYIFEHPAPISFTMTTGLQSGVISLSTGLLQRLNPSEVEAILALELAILKNRLKFRNVILEKLGKTWLLIGESIDRFISFNFMKKWTPFTRLFFPLTWLHIKAAFPRKVFFKSEKMASSWLAHPNVLAHALWKIHNSSLSQNFKGQNFNIQLGAEHHFLIPLTFQKTILFQLQPSIEERLKKLVGYFPI